VGNAGTPEGGCPRPCGVDIGVIHGGRDEDATVFRVPLFSCSFLCAVGALF